MKDWLEIQFWKIAKIIIKKEYGANCEDYSKNCASCEAKKIIKWIDEHINLIRFFK